MEPDGIVRLDPTKRYFVMGDNGLEEFGLDPDRESQLALLHDDEPLTPADLALGQEKGASGANIFYGKVEQRDYNPEWEGDVALDNIERMRSSDASIRSILQVIKLPLVRATWKIDVGAEDGGDDEDKKRAKKIHHMLVGGRGRHEAWSHFIAHVLLKLDFGHSVVEKVWGVDNEGYYFPTRLAPRLPQTIKEYRTNPDGTLKSVIQEAPKNGKIRKLIIPGQYVMHFSYDQEGDNYWGRSILRYVWAHYFYKTEFYRIDAVRLDRFGVGIPMIEVAKDYVIRPNEKREAENILAGLRSHHRAYVMLPEQLKLKILTPENESGGVSGMLDAIDHHDVMIARSILAHFLTMGQQRHGNYGTSSKWADMFLFALQTMAKNIQDEVDRQLIREIYDLNWDIEDREYPKLSASSIEDINSKDLAAAIYNLVLGQVVTPDDDLERHIRTIYGFPRIQKGFSREERIAMGLLQPGGVPMSPAAASPNVVTGKPSPDDKQNAKAQGLEPTPGTLPSTTPPPAGPERIPGDRG